jgi:hypothetical protein
MQTIFYFEKERNEILGVCNEVQPGKFHILEKAILRDYTFYKEINSLELNPLHPFSDPFSRDDLDKLSGVSYRTYLEFQLQKRDYLLIGPIRQHL